MYRLITAIGAVMTGSARVGRSADSKLRHRHCQRAQPVRLHRRGAFCLLALCLALLGFSATADGAIERHMILEGRHTWNFGWGEEPREGTWQANIDGTSFRPSIYTWGEL